MYTTDITRDDVAQPVRKWIAQIMSVGTRIAIVAGVLGLWGPAAGCVENYQGSRMEVNITVQPNPSFGRLDLIVPTPGVAQGDPAWFSHYELHARILGQGTVRLASFLIQPSLQIHHPCEQFIEDTYCRSTDATPCSSPYLNLERFSNIDDEILVAVSVPLPTDDGTDYVYDPGFNLMDRSRFPDELFVNPNLADPAQKLDRGNLNRSSVEVFCASLPDGYYLGNPNQLTRPLHGEILGAVDSEDARTGFAVGGITLFTPVNLEYMSDLMLTRERDPSRVNAENRDVNLPPGEDGQLVLLAQKHGAWGSIEFNRYRGMMTVHMESPIGLPITWASNIYYNMNEDPVGF